MGRRYFPLVYPPSILAMMLLNINNNIISPLDIENKGTDNLSSDQLPACNNKSTWIQDWDFARDHGQYNRWVYPNGPYTAGRDRAFKPSSGSPYPWRTSWKWHSDVGDADCQVNIMTHEKLCNALFDLNVYQLLFYGDSLTEMMYTAFMNKLGDNVNVKGGHEGRIFCTKNGTGTGNSSSLRYEINVLHERDAGGNAFPRSPRGVYEISNKSQAFISASLSDRTIGIFNIGAHYHNFSHYR